MVGSKDCISSARNNISVLKEISEARHSENPMQLMNHSAASVSLKPSSILKSKAFHRSHFIPIYFTFPY